MKPSFLGLLIAAVAFGASTIYLSVQLNEERTRADQFIEESRALNVRIAELTKARAELELLRPVDGAVASVALAPGGKPTATVQDTAVQTSTPEAVAEAASERTGPPGMPQPSEAMQRMRRSQLRANNKRLHADIGEKLGLSSEDANKLVDLITDQQMAAIQRNREGRTIEGSGESRVNMYEVTQQKNLAEVTALIGSDKAELYKQYQESMPARQEVNMLQRQLEGNDSTLSKDQRDRMITALAEERKRVPEPKFAESASREEHAKAALAWQEDYQERAATRARSILSSEQLATYDEYQQWSREMRQQYETRRAARGDDGGSGGPRGAQPPRPPR